jgi:hypothetical protein
MTESDERPLFGPADVIPIASNVTVEDGAFIIGGQATNLWAWFFREQEPELKVPLTSADIDYFGPYEAAKKFADAVGGEVLRPSPEDMNTPNTAVVITKIGGHDVKIDFLNGVLGVRREELQDGVSLIALQAEVNGEVREVQVPVLHPVLCLKSRVANMLSPILARRDPLARRQLRAAVVIVRRYIDDALIDGDWKEVKHCLSAIFRYLRSDQFGKRADAELNVDILAILKSFVNDDRIDFRYRFFQLKPMIALLELKRATSRRMTL